MFSRWRCRNLGEIHKPPVAVIDTENIKSTKTISNRCQHVYNYPCRQCYDFFIPQKHLGAIWYFNTEKSMKRNKIKNHETEFEMTESENFWNHSELLSTENENCYIDSVKREYSCLRRDCLKRLRCI